MRRDSVSAAAAKRVLLCIAVLTQVAALVLAGVFPASADKKPIAAKLTTDRQIIHLLNRMTFGPRPGDVEKVKRIGIDKYIDEQLHPERIDDSAVEARLAGLDSLHMSIAEILEKYPQPNKIARELGLGGKQNQAGVGQLGSQADAAEVRRAVLAYYREHGLRPPQALLGELEAQKLIRAVYSERQLQEVMTDFWFNHFNIDWRKGADKWLVTDFEMNAIRPHTLGKFKDLLMATAKSPAMLFYLDNFLSSSPDAQPGKRRMGQGIIFGLPRIARQFMRDQNQAQAAKLGKGRKPGINENYARELMELHTMGVDGGYTQKDVQEVARCFTGWTIDQPRRGGHFIFRDWMHDNGEKIVLGHRIPAGGGIKDGEMVIDILVHHPSTAKFISTKLVRRFVSDNPPQSLVDRVASVYTKTDGDIREMLRTIFTSPEFNSPEAYRAKIKSPFELAVSAIRALGGDTDGSPQLSQFIAKMGQPLYRYQAPTGYPDRAEQWVNTGALLERLNFGLALSAGRIPGTTVDLKRAIDGIDSAQPDRVMERAITILLGGDVSPQTRQVLEKQLKSEVPVKGQLSADDMEGDGKRGTIGLRGWNTDREAPVVASIDPQIAKVFGLVLGSPEFQRR
jgi:uncharacterized protein (DUF1800 family)